MHSLRREPTDERRRTFTPAMALVVLVLVRVVILAIAIERVHTRPIDEPTILRFHEIADTRGRPWRDFEVEYPPGQTLVIRLLGKGDLASGATRFAILAFGADLGTAWLLARHWGTSTAVRYLVLGLPLLVYLYLRLDLVSIALVTASFVLVRDGRSRAGGVCFAASVLFRLWPLVLAPVLLTGRTYRAVIWASAAFIVGAIGWIAWGGSDAVRQVITYRGATGWEIGSSVGVVIWTLTGGPIRFEAGAFRVGSVGWARVPLMIVLGAALVAVWTKARNRLTDPAGAPALAAVAALLLCSPVFSDGFLSWLLPWAAISAIDGSLSRFRVVLAICVLQGIPFFLGGHLTPAMFQVLTLVRDPLALYLVASWLWQRSEDRSRDVPVGVARTSLEA